MKLKGLHFADVAEIQEAVTDELKRTEKEEFSAAFQKLYDRAKACMYANGAYSEFKKKGICLLHVSSIFKKISPKTSGSHCVVHTWVYKRWYLSMCDHVDPAVNGLCCINRRGKVHLCNISIVVFLQCILILWLWSESAR
jgi:hypothetical protein